MASSTHGDEHAYQVEHAVTEEVTGMDLVKGSRLGGAAVVCPSASARTRREFRIGAGRSPSRRAGRDREFPFPGSVRVDTAAIATM
jgi:hypothetical protein